MGLIWSHFHTKCLARLEGSFTGDNYTCCDDIMFHYSSYGTVVIPHVLYQVSNTKEVMEFISTESGCSVTTLLTSCLSLCMTLVLTSYALQHHSECSSVKDERSVALHNLLLNCLSEEVKM